MAYNKKYMDDYRPKHKERLNAQARESRARLKQADPVRYKAMLWGSKLGWGRKGGATVAMEQLLKAAMGFPCKYCDEDITVDIASLDHRIPSKPKNNGLDNLQIICLSCNRIKSNLTDGEFTVLLTFLADFPEMEEKVLKRLRASNMIWGR